MLEFDTCCLNLRFLAFPDAPHYGNDSLHMGCRQLLQQIKYDVWCIIKLIQRWKNHVPNIGRIPNINGCLTMKSIW